MCRRAVHGDDFRAAFTGNRIGREAFAVGDVVNINGFVFKNTRRLKEILVNRAGTFVMQVCLRHFDAVKLTLQHCANHNVTFTLHAVPLRLERAG
ncbi:hypothetical protein D3C87_1895220 [compost metagenome]